MKRSVRNRRVASWRAVVTVAVIGASALAIASPSLAAPAGAIDTGAIDTGAIDTGFGVNGALELPDGALYTLFADGGRDRVLVASLLGGLDPDAPITTVEIRRFTRGGRLDPTFGSGGLRRLRFTETIVPLAIARTSRGVVLVATAFDATVIVLRLRDDGRIDRGFGRDGRVVVPFLPSTVSSRILMVDARVSTGPQGGVQVLAKFFFTKCPPCDSNTVWIRLDDDGGLRGTSFGADWSGAFAPNGDLVALVGPTRYEPDRRPFLARFTAEGTFALPFGTAGSVELPCGSQVDVAADGRIIVTCRTSTGFRLFAFDPSGRKDRSFNGDGQVEFALPTPVASAGHYLGVALARDGRLVLSRGLDGSRVWVGQIDESGRWDRTFSGDGRVTIRRSTGEFGGEFFLDDETAVGDSRILVRWSGAVDEIVAITR